MKVFGTNLGGWGIVYSVSFILVWVGGWLVVIDQYGNFYLSDTNMFIITDANTDTNKKKSILPISILKQIRRKQIHRYKFQYNKITTSLSRWGASNMKYLSPVTCPCLPNITYLPPLCHLSRVLKTLESRDLGS